MLKITPSFPLTPIQFRSSQQLKQTCRMECIKDFYRNLGKIAANYGSHLTNSVVSNHFGYTPRQGCPNPWYTQWAALTMTIFTYIFCDVLCLKRTYLGLVKSSQTKVSSSKTESNAEKVCINGKLKPGFTSTRTLRHKQQIVD